MSCIMYGKLNWPFICTGLTWQRYVLEEEIEADRLFVLLAEMFLRVSRGKRSLANRKHVKMICS